MCPLELRDNPLDDNPQLRDNPLDDNPQLRDNPLDDNPQVSENGLLTVEADTLCSSLLP